MTHNHVNSTYDSIIVGSGPNGLAAAITLARAGQKVLVLEAESMIGGGARSAELTLPGFVHDLGSAIHPLGVGSPFFRTLPLEQHGLRWIHPPIPLAHPLDDGTAVTLHRSIRTTGVGLGSDGAAYWQVMAPVVRNWHKIAPVILGPLRPTRNLIALVHFGLRAIWPARAFAEVVFKGERARALFAGLAAHSILPLEQPTTSAFGLVLGALGHDVGWPFPAGGAQRIADALAAYLRSLGGEIVTHRRVESIGELPPARAVLLDVTPRQVLAVAGARLPEGYRRALSSYRYGPGVFKLDIALDGPIPWRAKECAQAGTVHLGGTLEEIAASERAMWRGDPPERPYVLLAQQSLFDPTRAPAGKHTVWAYCHVPNGSTFDMTERIESQIERFAPGFRNRIIARSALGPADLECRNANHIGGDINGGAQDIRQLFTRPVPRLDPYSTPAPGIYICSSSTPPGGGVHGMCGYHAAQSALRDLSTQGF
jgi:phytoene dehydrogenase-like protein